MGSVNPINMLVDALARGAGLIHDITTARQIMRVLTMAEKHKLPPEVVAAGMPSSESFWRHEQARGHRPMLTSVFAGFFSLCIALFCNRGQWFFDGWALGLALFPCRCGV